MDEKRNGTTVTVVQGCPCCELVKRLQELRLKATSAPVSVAAPELDQMLCLALMGDVLLKTLRDRLSEGAGPEAEQLRALNGDLRGQVTVLQRLNATQQESINTLTAQLRDARNAMELMTGTISGLNAQIRREGNSNDPVLQALKGLCPTDNVPAHIVQLHGPDCLPLYQAARAAIKKAEGQ